ncbi:MAG: class I SAM-dependent methyltransferase [Pseudomonadales bacterium]|nr:class I SAM-dependent methyltransferase [Pseudomonadales bacterium]
MSQASNPAGWAGKVFGWIMERSNLEMNRVIVSEMELSGDENILEIGCGTGNALFAISQRIPAGTALGIDHSRLMVNRATKNNLKKRNVQTECVDLEQFNASPNSFDQILLSNVHQFWEEPVECFNQIKNLLKPDGILTIVLRIKEPENNSFFSRIGYDEARQTALLNS